MKNIKTIAALFLAFVLVFAMGMTAFAEGEAKGKITIGDYVDGETYSIYKMFDLESYDGDSYAYKITDAWKDFVKTGAGKDYFDLDEETGYVTAKSTTDDSDAADIAAAALAYAKENKLEPVVTLPENGSYVASDLDLGYYFVDSSLGALCGLNTTDPEATINEKNTAPIVEKKVLEETNNNGVVDSGELWGPSNNANIGDTVRFQITVHAKKGANGYVVTDTMSSGLTFQSISSVKVGDSALAEITDYVVAPTADGFTVTFTEAYLASIEADTDIVIEYTAVLNDNASVGSTGNSNKVVLSYGDKSADGDTNPNETEEVETKTYTYEFSILKYSNGNESDRLEGAGFTLYSDSACENVVRAEVLTDANGNITFSGLDAGTYYLKETTTPDGYNRPASAITVVIDDNGVVTDAENNVVMVENKSGALLPSTGGIGTTIFYILGGALVLCAVVVLVSKKRMTNEA